MPRLKGVSVIIAAYNPNEEVFKQLVNSLIGQTLLPKQIIIIDDHSENIIDTIDHELITLRRLDTNRGPAYARNVALELVNSEYVAFTDSDCIPNEDWLESLVNHFNEDLFSGVTGPYEDYNSYTSFAARLENSFLKSLQLQQNSPYQYATTANFLTKFSYIQDANGFNVYTSGLDSFNNYYNEDGELAKAICTLTERDILWTPEITVKHFINTSLVNIIRRQFILVRGILHSNNKSSNESNRAIPTISKKAISTISAFSILLTIIDIRYFVPSLIFILSTNSKYYYRNITILPLALAFHILCCFNWVLSTIFTYLEIGIIYLRSSSEKVD